MNAALQKLNSKRGASIILALMFFLICAVIGSIVLASASSNAGRLNHMRDEQQAYLTVSSAAKLVQSELDGQSYVVVKTIVDSESPSYSYTPAGGEVKAHLNAWAEYIYINEGVFPPSGNITISSALDEVSAVFSMDSNYNITIELSLSDVGDERYQMTLTLSAMENTQSVTSTREYEAPAGFDEDGNPVTAIYTEVTVTTTTTVTWGSPVIIKGGA